VKNKIIEIIVIILLIGIAIGLLFANKNQKRETKTISEIKIHCDFEKQNISEYFYTNKYDTFIFKGDTSKTFFSPSRLKEHASNESNVGFFIALSKLILFSFVKTTAGLIILFLEWYVLTMSNSASICSAFKLLS
jgi:hypothetical protein